MTLLITVFAAVVTTIVWYLTVQKKDLKLGKLCLWYWAASIMWLVDAVMEYQEMGAAYFEPNTEQMINDAFLGCCVVVLGLAVWIVLVVIRDPNNVWKNLHSNQNH